MGLQSDINVQNEGKDEDDEDDDDNNNNNNNNNGNQNDRGGRRRQLEPLGNLDDLGNENKFNGVVEGPNGAINALTSKWMGGGMTNEEYANLLSILKDAKVAEAAVAVPPKKKRKKMGRNSHNGGGSMVCHFTLIYLFLFFCFICSFHFFCFLFFSSF